MEFLDKIHGELAKAGSKATGAAPLHETHTPAVIFTTEDGRAYRVDYPEQPGADALAADAKTIEAVVGVKVDWYGPTRAEPERRKAEEARAEESRRQAREADAKSVPVQPKAEKR